MTDTPSPAVLTDDARQTIIDAEVAKAVRDGWIVERSTSSQVILTRPRRLSFWLNALGLVLTSGLWVIYIAWRLLNRRRQSATLVVTVDATGRVTRS